MRTPGAVDSLWLAFDHLTQYDQKLQPQPMLAESWDVTPDYKQLKFNLRKGVTFHSGREFTSEDVKWNLVRVRRPDAASGQYAAQSNWFTGIDTPDKYTIVLTSEESRPALFDLFENLNMLDPQSIDIEAGPKQTKVVGTGPFVFKEWAQGDHLSFERNPNYWENGKPYLDGLQANVRDIQAATVQLEAGALDIDPQSAGRRHRPPGAGPALHQGAASESRVRSSNMDSTAASHRSTTSSCARRSTTR